MELRLNNLTKEFAGFRAVDGLELTMTRGVYGLLGVNGAGKTTLMRMLCTLMRPTEGSITYNGRDIFAMDGQYRRLIGYLPQEFGFYPEFTVRDYLRYIASIKGIRSSVSRQLVEELIGRVGLAKAAGKKMKKLSGGMKRRAGIAQALLNDPKVLILDEPTAGLDPNERIRFRNLISELSEERLVLLSTHIVSDVEYIADQILMMKDGKIIESGSAGEIIAGMPCSTWECRVSRQKAHEMMGRYRIANMRTEGESIWVRLVSSRKPFDNAICVESTLEDAFLYYFGEKAGNGNAEI